jgi:hypothetical protein
LKVEPMPARDKATLQQTTFNLSGDRAVRLAFNLKCPHCGAELKVGDVGADSFILTVG